METAKFSINRLFLLIQRQLVINLKNLLVSFSACFGVLIIISFLQIYHTGRVDYEPMITLSLILTFIGGYIFTSIGFNELHSPDKSYQYLTLPATTFEKLLSVWLLTSILYVLVSLILIGIVAILCNLFALFVGSSASEINKLFTFPIWKVIWIYMITQPIFLLGSCYFRRNNFLKTLLALFIIGIILGIYAGINGYIFFGSAFHSFDNDQMNGAMTGFMQDTFPAIMKFAFNYLMAPFFYVVSYFVLKERQV